MTLPLPHIAGHRTAIQFQLTVKVTFCTEIAPEAGQTRDRAGCYVAREVTGARVLVSQARRRRRTLCRHHFRRERQVRLGARQSAKICQQRQRH